MYQIFIWENGFIRPYPEIFEDSDLATLVAYSLRDEEFQRQFLIVHLTNNCKICKILFLEDINNKGKQ